MAFVCVLLYLFVSYIFPGQIFPDLTPLRLTYWIGILGLVASVVSIVKRRGAPLRCVQLYILTCFAIVLMLSWALADRWLGAVPESIQQFAPSFTMFVLAVCNIDSLKKLRTVMVFMVLLTLVLVLQGFEAFHFGYNSKMFLLSRQYVGANEEVVDDDSYDADAESYSQDETAVPRIRGLGIFHDPNDLGLGLVTALALTGILTTSSRFRNTLLVFLPSAALCYGVYLTRSRGGFIGVLVTLLLAFSSKGHWWRSLLLVAALGAGGIAINIGGGRALSSSDESATGRIDAWAEGLQMLKSQPILGVGYRQFTEHHILTAHNSFVLCMAETGLIGYFLWLSLLTITLLELQKLKTRPEDTPTNSEVKKFAVILQRAILAFITAGFFISRTYVPMLYLLFGLAAALILIARKEDVRIQMPSWPRLGALVLAGEIASIMLIYIITKIPMGGA